MSVNYEVLNKFLDADTLELEYHRVTNNIKELDIEKGIDVIFDYYRKFGFPHYTIRDDERYDHMRKLKKFLKRLLKMDGKILFLLRSYGP